MSGQPGDIHIFVGLPGAAGNEGKGRPGRPGLELGHGAGRAQYVGHAVKAGVAGHGDVFDADGGEQAARVVVLHEDMGEAAQHVAEHATAGAEKALRRTEYARYDVCGYAAAAELAEVVAPELILDEYGAARRGGVEEAAHGRGRVRRQILDGVGQRIVVSHLVARRGEEREQYLHVGALAADALDDGAPLLKLAQRGGVHPHVEAVGSHAAARLGQATEGVSAPGAHMGHLGRAGRGDGNAEVVEGYAGVIQRVHRGPGYGLWPRAGGRGSLPCRGFRSLQTYAGPCTRPRWPGGRRSSHCPCAGRCP